MIIDPDFEIGCYVKKSVNVIIDGKLVRQIENVELVEIPTTKDFIWNRDGYGHRFKEFKTGAANGGLND